MGNVEVTVSRGERLEDALERVRSAFEAAGHQVHIPAEPLGSSEFVRYFHAATGTQSGSTVVVVTTSPWTDHRAVGFLNAHFAALEAGSELAWRFVSAWPVHALVEYIFGSGDAGRLEAAALAATSDNRLSEANAPELAALAVTLVREHLRIELDLDDPKTVRTLDNLVLEALRPCDDPSLALLAGTYRPGAALEVLGAAFGEVIRRGHADRMKWSAAPDLVGGSFPVLEVEGGEDVTCLLPVDRVFRCYQEGSDRSLVRYFDVVVDDVMEGPQPEQDTSTWELLGPRVVPVLKPAGWTMSMDVVRRGFLPDGPVNSPMVVLAVDHPTRISFVLEERLRQLEMSPESVFDRAMENLRAMSRDLDSCLVALDVDEGLPIVRLDCDDYFNASRALLGGALFRAAACALPERAHYLLGVPNRDILVVAAPENRAQFYVFQSLVRWFHERQPAPISSLCFELGPGGVLGHRDTEGDAE
jgi:uncharacterized protein YtpQ (UPF0354 family)